MNRTFLVASVAVLSVVGCSSGNEVSPTPNTGGSSSGAGGSGAGGQSSASGSSSVAGGGSPSAAGSAGTSSSTAGTGGTPGGGAGSSQGGSAGSPQGGSAGSSGSAGAAGGGMGSGCSGLALCDDFEAYAAGAAPTGWTVFKPGGCSGSAAYSANVDTTQFRSGGKSIKVVGGDSCGPMLVNTAAFAKLTGGEVYGRFFVRMPSVAPFDHAVMAALGLQGGIGTATQFEQANNLSLAPEQIGSMNALVWQTEDGNILPAKSPAAAATTTFPKADTWTCIEFHVSANTMAIETWVDSQPVPGMTFIPGTTAANQEVNGQWKPAALAPTAFGLGWIVYSGPAISLWFDDAALGTTRIGCN